MPGPEGLPIGILSRGYSVTYTSPERTLTIVTLTLDEAQALARAYKLCKYSGIFIRDEGTGKAIEVY